MTRWPGCGEHRCPRDCSETLMVPSGLPWLCCMGDAWLSVHMVGPELLLGAESKDNKCLIENKRHLAAWWAGISSWLHGAACLGWGEELARH